MHAHVKRIEIHREVRYLQPLYTVGCGNLPHPPGDCTPRCPQHPRKTQSPSAEMCLHCIVIVSLWLELVSCVHTCDDGPVMPAPVLALQCHVPHQRQGHHHKKLEVADPSHHGVCQHPVACVQDSVLVNKVLWTHAKPTHKPTNTDITRLAPFSN